MFRNSVARLLSKDGVASLTQSLQLSRGGISGPSVNSGTVVTAARRRGFASAQEGGEAAAEAGAKPGKSCCLHGHVAGDLLLTTLFPATESIINWVVPAIGVPGLVGWFIYQVRVAVKHASCHDLNTSASC